MKKYIVIIAFLFSCFTAVAQHIAVIPLDKPQHTAEAARIFKAHFRTPTFAELFENNIATVNVCMLDNTVIGVMAYKKIDALDAQKNRNRHLYYFAIDKQYQNKGYGATCMKLLEDQARREGVKTITLDPSLKTITLDPSSDTSTKDPSSDISTKDPSLFFKEKLNYKPISPRSTTLTKTLS
jgi:GNAT superfamily N-acetyltransferase